MVAAKLRSEIIVTEKCIPIDIGIALAYDYIIDLTIDARVHT